MADHETLRRYVRRLDPASRSQLVADSAWLSDSEAVTRRDESQISIDVLVDLMDDLSARLDTWADPSTSDRWLAPRIHYALRLTRAEASDPDVWAWLAIRFHWYVEWRWEGRKGIVENRWRGEIHKQAFARLWWGGELFRNGAAYEPVVGAFIRQDLPNSYLHRPLVRCRSLALALVDMISPIDGETVLSADDVNDLARVLNLATAGSPPEVQTGFQRDDIRSFQRWVAETPRVPADWDVLPVGPACSDTSEISLTGGRVLATRGWEYAHAAAERLDTRSAQRRAARPTTDAS
ncbi:DUF6339 family protein [Rhodococcus sp. PvR099]|uniref:DUF6339 family protein n=1 Tax=Rhodococcus sp. PvR099 TaxID=2806602 RepID=UPI001AE79896|nr:DUF6339 family protein [Rhodococcus sp. PvR099]MBP1159805.1 hypothetical protein [Rhodococcus sp. PvR099]